MSLVYNAVFDKNTRKLAFEDKAGNEIYSFVVPKRTPTVDDIRKPLTFKATQDGSTVKLTKYGSPSGTFQTSRDGGNTWTNYTLNTAIALNIGDKVSFRAKYDRTSGQDYRGHYFYFEMTGKIEAWHNPMSLYRTNDFATYESMVEYCFFHLFENCTSLTKAPVLPFTTLNIGCYWDMFKGTSLTEAPELPATTLANSCYKGMFFGCKSLTKAPELPATTLAIECYSGMFRLCTSLTKSPELTAPTLSPFCFQVMFDGCSSLNEVRCKIPSSYSSSQISSYANSWLSGVSSTGAFYTNADAHWPSGASGIPTSWTRVNEVAKDDITKPLTLKATQDGSTVKLKKDGSPVGAFQTSRDGGNTWEDYTIDNVITLNTGDEVSFRAKANRTSSAQNYNNYFYFEMTGKIEAWHNVMSLYRTNDFATYKSVVNYAFSRMFNACTSLVKAPALPATTLADSCYYGMFSSCTSLTKAPELPATTLERCCYLATFIGCTSLTKAPELPATTLEYQCYRGMFQNCTSLTEAPELPVTKLDTDCYGYMFYGCASLVNAPALPAYKLATDCYEYMFYGCASLKEVRISATTTAHDALTDWLDGVSATGDFYCNPNATIFPTDSASGIPANWTRRALSDYPVTP